MRVRGERGEQESEGERSGCEVTGLPAGGGHGRSSDDLCEMDRRRGGAPLRPRTIVSRKPLLVERSAGTNFARRWCGVVR